MLKWAVHHPRPSYLPELAKPMPSAGSSAISTYKDFMPERGKLKRKTCCSTQQLNGWRYASKANQLTSTPRFDEANMPIPRSPLIPRKLQHLHDLSNILPEPVISPLVQAESMTMVTPMTTTTSHALPAHYASTLPNFDAEYSPYGPIPGPLLALRGLGVPDSYFEQPRYLAGRLLEVTAAELEQKSLQVEPQTDCMEQSTLSSSKMGDATLERMIDAILQSTRKERNRTCAQTLQHQQQQQQRRRLAVVSTAAATHSPTYRPAYDPANDLREYWHTDANKIDCENFVPYPLTGYQEREVCSPPDIKIRHHELRRQRVVRRKHKFAHKISASVRQSAQKLFAMRREQQQQQQQQREQTNQKAEINAHISPDSGHNSTSEFEEAEEEQQLQAQAKQKVNVLDAAAEEAAVELNEFCYWQSATIGSVAATAELPNQKLDATKRRLSFNLED